MRRWELLSNNIADAAGYCHPGQIPSVGTANTNDSDRRKNIAFKKIICYTDFENDVILFDILCINQKKKKIPVKNTADAACGTEIFESEWLYGLQNLYPTDHWCGDRIYHK